MGLLSAKFLIGAIRRRIILSKKQEQWRKLNMHNETCPVNIFPINKVEVGNYTYGDLQVFSYRNPDEKLIIGNFCSIASDVKFVLSGEHDYKRISTYPMDEKFFGKKYESICKGPIKVDDDVWIGTGATVLSGVHIGQGSIIGAGSVVTSSIPPYSIFANGEIIKKRFNDYLCDKLVNCDLSRLNRTIIESNYDIFHKHLDENLFDDFTSLFASSKDL